MSRTNQWQNWVGHVAFSARSLIGLVPAVLTAACAPVDVLNALVPRDNYHVVRNVAYGEGPRRSLDIYIPDHVRPDAPVIVFFYGGSWREGEKSTYLFAGQALATKGFITVIPDYRIYPEVRFPAFLDDAASATRWVHDHIANYGGDPKQLFLIGHSAGAYLAVMLSLNAQYLNAVGLDPARDIRATVGLAGPYDFLPLHDPVLKEIFGPEDQLAVTQPINFASAKSPPMLLAAGTDDTTVDPGNTSRLTAKLRADGVAVEELHYPGLNHATLVGALGVPLRFLAPVRADVLRYLDQTLSGQRPGAGS